ncbi:MAG: helix-turn-helix domain-containing protein [Bryobacteraceae bacterium]|jgi:excisionase family DNA binding protein
MDGSANANTEKLTLSVAETMQVLGIGRNSVYEAIRQRQIPALKIGRRIVIPRAALQRLLEGAGQKA